MFKRFLTKRTFCFESPLVFNILYFFENRKHWLGKVIYIKFPDSCCFIIKSFKKYFSFANNFNLYKKYVLF